MTASEPDVLVVGAGPSGLAVALQAHDHGARVRVLERRTRAFRPSRALIVYPRTLEVLRPLGVTDALVDRGDLTPSVRLHIRHRQLPVSLGELPIDGTAFPHLLFVGQAVVEQVLAEALAARGIAVEYGTEVVGVRGGSAGAEVTWRRGQGSGTLGCRFLAGCDGSSSTVRDAAGIDWRGARYRQEVVLADIELSRDLDGGSHAVPGRGGVLFLFGLDEQASVRLLATRPAELCGGQPGRRRGAVAAGELQALIDDAGLDARITSVAWSARVPLQRRIASRYRAGSLFLVGDAAHVHSPAAGQGMNTGLQDATNLGWKLAFAATGRPAGRASTERLLDSYDAERRPAGRRVLALTRAVFWAEAGTGPVASRVRTVLVPAVAPVLPYLLRNRPLVSAGMRILSQLDLTYRSTLLPSGDRSRSRYTPPSGRRLPDGQVTVGGRQRRLHDLLARAGMHVLLERSGPPLDPSEVDGRVHLWRVESWPGHGVTVVRPDGYVGYHHARPRPEDVTGWLAEMGAGVSG